MAGIIIWKKILPSEINSLFVNYINPSLKVSRLQGSTFKIKPMRHLAGMGSFYMFSKQK